MGEAKRRGNKEQRTLEAIARKEVKQAEAKHALSVRAQQRQVGVRNVGRIGVGFGLAVMALSSGKIREYK